MTTKRQLEKRLTEIGYGPLQEDDVQQDQYGYWNYTLHSPAGSMFTTTECHALCGGGTDTKGKMYAAIINDIGDGLIPCAVAGKQGWCDTCDETENQ